MEFLSLVEPSSSSFFAVLTPTAKFSKNLFRSHHQAGRIIKTDQVIKINPFGLCATQRQALPSVTRLPKAGDSKCCPVCECHHHRSASRCPPQRRVVWSYLRAHAEHAVDYGRGFSDFLILT